MELHILGTVLCALQAGPKCNKPPDISQCIHYDQFYIQLTVRYGAALQNAVNNVSDTRIFIVFVGKSHERHGRDFSVTKALDVRRCGHFQTCYHNFDHLSVCWWHRYVTLKCAVLSSSSTKAVFLTIFHDFPQSIPLGLC